MLQLEILHTANEPWYGQINKLINFYKGKEIRVTSWQWNSASRSVMSNWLSVTPRTIAHQAPVLGILQARALEWVDIPLSRGSSRLRDWTQVSCNAGRFFTDWAAREVLVNSQTWIKIKISFWEFLGDSVVGIQCFHCCRPDGPQFNPWSENQYPWVASSQNKNQRKRLKSGLSIDRDWV